MIFTLGDIAVDIVEEDDAVRVTTDSGESVILDHLTPTFVEDILKGNFQFVKTYYESKACIYIAKEDISILSLQIVDTVARAPTWSWIGSRSMQEVQCG